MPKSHARYASEYRHRMVELVRAGRSPDELAKEFEPTAQSIGAWAAAADKQAGRREEVVPGMVASERDELARLRRENKQLRLERIFSQKPRPGLPGRPARCRRALPVHEHEPGLLPDRHHGARARRVQGWLLRLGSSAAVGPCYR